MIYESGQWQVDLGRRELLSSGVAVPIGARAFEIIELLVRSANELVSKNDIMNRIWPGAIVGDNTLQVHISAIRKALGPGRAMLKTASGRGYRLLGNWTARQQGRASAAAVFPPLPEPVDPLINPFPLLVTRLIGRAAAVRHVRDLVSAYRVVTLTGPGGIGKTSLAIKSARGLLTDFAGGGWFVELASLSNPDLVPSTIARVLGLKFGGEVSAEAVARAVGAKRLLLVLDNCEHVIDAAASLVERFVRLCPHVTIFVTSREVLRIEGETVYRVPPLDVPAPGQTTQDQILGLSAVELFITRTNRLDAVVAPGAEELTSVATICRSLDGIPLAIELAAASAAMLGIAQVALGLRDRFALLTRGRRTALARQKTLRATLDWSHELLPEAERRLLRCLAVFSGGFTVDAAAAVMADTGLDATAVTDGITSLVMKSLVMLEVAQGAPRWYLLDTIRAYALEKLAGYGEANTVCKRHAGYFRDLFTPLAPSEKSSLSDEDLARCVREIDNVRAALDWCFSPDGDPAIGLVLTLAAVPLWFELSQMAVTRGRVEQALPHAAEGSDVEMRLQIALGHAHWYSTPESDAVEPAFARALEIAERIGATDAQTQALWGLWAAHRGHGDYPAALEIARHYATAAANAGDVGAIHLGDRILGLTHHAMGHQTIAREFAERALGQPLHFNPNSGIGYQVETPVAIGALLARILWLLGFPDQAMAAAARATEEARNSGSSFPVIYSVTFAGFPVALLSGATAEARRQVDLLATHAAGNRRAEQWIICYKRILELREGTEREALVASFMEPRLDTASAPPFSELALDANIPVPLPGPEPVDVAWNTPELLRVHAELQIWHAAPGAVVAAESKLLRALEIARVQSALSWELRAAMSLARLWRRHGQATEARDLLAGTYRKFNEGFGASDLIRARNMMTDFDIG